MSVERTLLLHDGIAMPRLGFGAYKIVGPDAAVILDQAFEAGYRSIDTAAFYGNEAEVGAAVRASGIDRADLFITTKLWNDDHGAAAARDAVSRSRDRLGIAIDLLLIHWPQPRLDRYVETWRALIDLREAGAIRSIGVSNFTEAHLTCLIDETGAAPTVNQVELHPRFQQKALRAFHARHGIATECWGPLGRARFLEDPSLAGIAAKHGRTSAQVVIRWHLESGLIAIPKSATPARIVENAAVFDFALDAEDHARIAAMDDPNGRLGMHPDHFG